MMNSDLYSLGAVRSPDDRHRLRQRRVTPSSTGCRSTRAGRRSTTCSPTRASAASWCTSTSPPTPRRWGATPSGWPRSPSSSTPSSGPGAADRTTVIVIATDPHAWTEGGAWWEVGVPEASDRPSIDEAPGRPRRRPRPSSGWGSSDGRRRAHRGPRLRADRPDARRAAGPADRRRRARRRPRRRADARRARWPSELGVPALDSAADVLAAGVDAVAICTSTDTHVELITTAAAAGAAIFCEKPISLDLAAVDVALAAVDDAGVLLHVGFNRRFDPAHASVQQAAASGELGAAAHGADHQPRSVTATDRLHRALRRAVPRHDDPRPRHGPLRHRAARSSRCSPTAACASIRRSARPATSTPPSSTSATPTAASR